jgi:methylenetetrahydrofolate dehydrogenase (NADP+) / methenyltetrahydrofolate cyclohydrolase
MTAQLIDGKAIAAKLRVSVSAEVADLARQGIKPGLAVVLVGEDPASQVYVRNKAAQTAEAGMESFEFRLPADTSEAALLALIEKLNADPAVDGILLQLPLPVQIEARRLLNAIDPSKDVDGFHPVNVGLVASGAAGIVPCTPLGSMLLLKSVRDNLSGLDAVVVGRSNIVGKPMAHLLTVENCTVTVCHSKSRDIPAICRRADILIAAVGRPEMMRGDWVKPGATIIDVGINRLATAEGKPRLVGDVRFAEACEIAGAITPVPGGVGPMTIACLLSNTVSAARRRRGLQ